MPIKGWIQDFKSIYTILINYRMKLRFFFIIKVIGKIINIESSKGYKKDCFEKFLQL